MKNFKFLYVLLLTFLCACPVQTVDEVTVPVAEPEVVTEPEVAVEPEVVTEPEVESEVEIVTE